MEDDEVLSLKQPESYLINFPGHLWRDKWTALCGPVSSRAILQNKFQCPPAVGVRTKKTNRTCRCNGEMRVVVVYVKYICKSTVLVVMLTGVRAYRGTSHIKLLTPSRVLKVPRHRPMLGS